MKLVETLVVRDQIDVIDAHISFHLNVGVDYVLATDHDSRDGTTEILEAYAADGYLRLFHERGEAREGDWRTRMARLAASEHEADWVIDTAANEFWWPRAESMKGALVAIPPRYTVVQALVRRFLARPVDDRLFAERMTVRPVVRSSDPGATSAPGQSLRPIYRAGSDLTLPETGSAVDAWRVPLRGWYPVEVFRYPVGHEAGAAVTEEEVERGLSEGSFVVDTRLVDALAQLHEAEVRDGRAYGLPVDGLGRLTLPVPSIVDDASYAVECAELGEVDLGKIERHIEGLEARIAALEARFWPRVGRAARRLARRRR